MTLPTALITGACGGIGKALVQRFRAAGYRLILVDYDSALLNELVQQTGNSEALICDLSNPEQLANLCETISSGSLPLDVLVLNAGIVLPGNLRDLSAADIDRQLDINLRSALHLLRAAAINMSAQKSGHIMATVSMGGIVALKGSAVYSATKAALRATLTALSDELNEHGVAVSGIYPSGVDTAMLRYEATHGGSALNFLNRPRTVGEVADAFMRALKTKRLEVYVPYIDSWTSRLFALFPWSLRRITPLLIKLGEKGREKFIRARDL